MVPESQDIGGTDMNADPAANTARVPHPERLPLHRELHHLHAHLAVPRTHVAGDAPVLIG